MGRKEQVSIVCVVCVCVSVCVSSLRRASVFVVVAVGTCGWICGHFSTQLCLCVWGGEAPIVNGRGVISIGLEKKYGLRPSCLLYSSGDGERNPYRGRAIAVFERLRR